MRMMTCIEDMRLLARRKVPKMFFEYADRGSYAEETLRVNRTDLERIKLRQRVLVDVARRDLATSIVGEPAMLPMVLAPVGLLAILLTPFVGKTVHKVDPRVFVTVAFTIFAVVLLMLLWKVM